ncbi:hypothetical protein HN836_03785 [Candidatus Woesearchaeota archaeon]|nr:hypothetical protein [Candidatus Woesearchaeota archaeon]
MEIIYIIVFIEILIYIIYKKSNLLLSKKDFFPNISNDLIRKFNSFDNGLGWVNQKNSIKKEPSQGKEIVYTYNELGARSIGDIDIKDSSISTYGDSYCLSREVKDIETWQYFLSKDLNTNIINFGVGNYGLDQSLLRLKKEYKNNPTNTVIMAITPYTITRITSVWKHFSEFENVLAFKPRFIVKNDKLEFISNIIKDKKQLLRIKEYQDYLYKYDEHINYFDSHIYKFPFIFSLIKNPKPLFRTVNVKLTRLFEKLRLPKVALWFSDKYFLPEIIYRKKLFTQNEKLLKLLIKDYVYFSKENNFTPILLMLPAIEDVKYYKKTKDKYYDNFTKKISDDIITLDFMDFLSHNIEKLSQYYIDNYWGGHYSVLGNLKLAVFLKERLNESKIII